MNDQVKEWKNEVPPDQIPAAKAQTLRSADKSAHDNVDDNSKLQVQLANRIAKLLGVHCVAVALPTERVPRYIPGQIEVSRYAESLVIESLQMARKLGESPAIVDVKWRNYKAFVYVTQRVSLSVIVDYGDPVTKSLRRAVLRALVATYKMPEQELPK